MSAANGNIEQAPGAGGEPAELNLPDFKVKKVAKSPKPLSETLSSKRLDRSTVFPVGDYTVGLAEGAANIQIFDHQGREIQGLDHTSVNVMDWASFNGSNEGKSYLGVALQYTSGMDWGSHKMVESFPSRLQPFVTAYVKAESRNGNTIPFPGDWRLIGNPDNMAVVENSGVLMLRDVNGISIAFDTTDKDGGLLPPRNWVRYDEKDRWAGKMPKGMKAVADNLSIKGVTSTFYTANDLILLSFADKLVVTKSGQKISDSFNDKLVGVGENVCEDPKTKGVIYFCSSKEPRSIIKLDTTQDSASWRTEAVDLPQDYKVAMNLRLDPTGNFFTMQTDTGFVVLDKNNLKELFKLDGIKRGIVDSQGKIRGIDGEGHLVIYDANFAEVAKANEARKVAMMAKGLTVDLFKREGEVPETATVDHAQYLEPVRVGLEAQFDAQLGKIADIGEISIVTEALTKLRTKLKSEGLQEAQIGFITKGIEVAVRTRERALAEPVVAEALAGLSAKVGSENLSIALIAEAGADLAKLKSIEGLVDDATKAQIRALENQLDIQSAELYRREGTVIESDILALVAGVRTQLESMSSMPDFADWQEYDLPHLKSRLGAMSSRVPISASELQQKFLAAQKQINELTRQREVVMREQYAQVREKASEIMGERVELVKIDIDSFGARLRDRRFADRSQAETYVRSSKSLEGLRGDIAEPVCTLKYPTLILLRTD